MTLTSLRTIKALSKKYGIWPSKTRGQSFLISQKVVAQVIQSADLKKNDIVLEIGPGLGVITQELAKRVKKVIAVEIDKKMVRVLKEILADYQNVEIIQGDILKLLTKKLQATTYKLISNLPFNITGQVLRRFLSEKPKPELMVLILQKEVAERIVAKPGQMGLLSVIVQFFAKPRIISRVRAGSFWPQPEVDSAIVKIRVRPVKMGRTYQEMFFRIVRAGFSSPRKKLLTNLLRTETRGKLLQIFQKLNLNPQARAQELSVEDWVKLAQFFALRVIHR